MTAKDWGEERFHFLSETLDPVDVISSDITTQLALLREEEKHEKAWDLIIHTYRSNADCDYWDEALVAAYYVGEYNVGLYGLYYLASYAPLEWLSENAERLLHNLQYFPENSTALLTPYKKTQRLGSRSVTKKDVQKLLYRYLLPLKE